LRHAHLLADMSPPTVPLSGRSQPLTLALWHCTISSDPLCRQCSQPAGQWQGQHYVYRNWYWYCSTRLFASYILYVQYCFRLCPRV